MTCLITGGAGFIGSAVVRELVARGERVVIVDKLTYAGNLDSLRDAMKSKNCSFEQADICDASTMRRLFAQYSPSSVLHLAAESHVDRSIDAPGEFIQTNVVGTFTLLYEGRRYWQGLPDAKRAEFRFLHVSTDEVFGSLGESGFFTEETAYSPNSPYSASKASSDHLVRAWFHTYGFPILVTNCSNNYGPNQFPEKLIPLVVLNAFDRKPLPVYGRGENVRDWLHVEDHANAILTVLSNGRVGETYLIGGRSERRNIDVVRQICQLVDELAPDGGDERANLIEFVGDRPGHDHRYAIDACKIERELGWQPQHSFDDGLRRTVEWYRDNRWWWERVRSGVYRGERLGLGAG